MEKQNKFRIITPSYNNEEWIEYNLASILNQTYTNYKVTYIDDASTDNTYEKVKETVGELPNWNVIKNSENKGATYNYFHNLDDYIEDSDEIIIHLDGDDWLYDENVLAQLNTFYNEKDCWMTYGGFVCWDGTEDPKLPYPQSTPYSEFIHNHKQYRRDEWRASHMRTYRGSLLKALPKDAIKTLENKQYYWHASDLAFQFAYMEMCPKDKIQVVDFYTLVYNQSKQNSERTQEREHVDNSKYEVEIRNRKHYKEGLTGERLPQVNLWNRDYFHEYSNIPTKFTFCYEQTDGEFDMTILCDPAILQYLAGEFKVEKNVPLVARIFEQREYFNRRIYTAILENYDKFDAILTYDRELLKILPNAIFCPLVEVAQFNRLPNPYGQVPYKSDLIDTYEISEDTYKVYPKSKLVSAIASSKAFLPGHVKRLEFIRAIQTKIDLFGRGMGREIPSKIDALRDYMFSVAIENASCDDNYFTEKLVDCFITGTVPIYHGCTNIGEFFDMRGIIYFENQEQLDEAIDSLTPEKYESMLEYVHINYKKALQLSLDNDRAYELYYKDIMNREVNRKPLINTKWY